MGVEELLELVTRFYLFLGEADTELRDIPIIYRFIKNNISLKMARGRFGSYFGARGLYKIKVFLY